MRGGSPPPLRAASQKEVNSAHRLEMAPARAGSWRHPPVLGRSVMVNTHAGGPKKRHKVNPRQWMGCRHRGRGSGRTVPAPLPDRATSNTRTNNKALSIALVSSSSGFHQRPLAVVFQAPVSERAQEFAAYRQIFADKTPIIRLAAPTNSCLASSPIRQTAQSFGRQKAVNSIRESMSRWFCPKTNSAAAFSEGSRRLVISLSTVRVPTGSLDPVARQPEQGLTRKWRDSLSTPVALAFHL